MSRVRLVGPTGAVAPSPRRRGVPNRTLADEVADRGAVRAADTLRGRSLRFTYTEAAVLLGPVVYIWVRNARALYVGSSAHGGSRCFSPRHHKLHIQSGDRLDVYPMPNVEDALAVEDELIAALTPPLNGPRTPRKPRTPEFRSPFFHRGVRP